MLRSERGFSMIEVLISLVVIAIALLGAAALQLQALKMGKGAATRMHAVTLAVEIAERMEANKSAAVSGSYAVALSTTARTVAKDCVSSTCSATELATADLGAWEARLIAALPSASWAITNTTTGNPSTYQIVVNWQDRRENTTYSTTGTSETYSYTSTKTVSQ